MTLMVATAATLRARIDAAIRRRRGIGPRRAQALYRAAWLLSMIDENERRIREIDRARNAPCRYCAAAEAALTPSPLED